MVTPLLKTKIHIPGTKSQIVHRPRLVDILTQHQECRLVLISAPAGFGKTTLITEWLRELRRPAGWVSLDQGDNDVTRFLGYIVLALQCVQGHFGENILEILQSSQHSPIEGILTALINEMADYSAPLTLVLDDYHVITERAVHDAVLYFLEHMPPNAQIVFATRSDPPWPVARFRARGEMVEFRAKDLRFTIQEARQFLNVVMGLDVSLENVEALEVRTEGWIAGLQMAALSMQGKTDLSEFIAALSGSHRFILDYLMEEVLKQQPSGIQEFMLRTSILERMSAPLCDALRKGFENRDWRLESDEVMDVLFKSPISTHQSPAISQQMLEYLEQNNLFVIPLDDERCWYRYHGLFADLLLGRLKQSFPDQVQDLYESASCWCEEHGFISEAINYAISAKSLVRATDLIEKHAANTIELGESATLLGWLEKLPEEILRTRPWIRIYSAWAMMQVGQLDAAEMMAGKIEDMLDEIRVPEVENAQHLKSYLFWIQANIAEMRGDRSLAVQLSEEALELLPASDLRMKSILLMLWSFSLRWSGNFEEAAKAAEEAVAVSEEIGNLRINVAALNDLAALRIYQGRLHEALAACEQALQIVNESKQRKRGLLLQSEGVTHYYMSRVFLEWNDLNAAMEAVSKGMDLCRRGRAVDIGIVGRADLIRALLAQGELKKAQDTISELKSTYPEVAAVRLPAIEVLVLIAIEDFAAAKLVIEGEGFSSEDAPDFGHLLMQRLLARVLIAEGKFEEALGFLDRLREFAEEKKVSRNTIEFLKLQAMALLGMGREDRAVDRLQKALVLGKGEGFIRTFIDDGEAMGKLLRSAKARAVETDYVTKLLAELEKDRARQRGMGEAPVLNIDGVQSSLVESLTERELQVLRLLRTDLSAPEIADQLFVAVSTVRSHTKSIYGKLDVHGRAAAVARAEELGLV